MRFSCPEQMLADVSPEERIRIVQRCGFDGIDCRFATLEDPAFARHVAQSGLSLASVYSQVRDPSLLEGTAAARARAVADIVHRARVAAGHGAENLIIVPVFGPPRFALGREQGDVTGIEASLLLVTLNEITAALHDVTITVVVEPLNREETHLLTNPAVAADLCERIGSPRVATMVDTYHCFQEGLDAAEQIRAVGRQLALVHLSDSARGLPGEGEVDFASVLRALDGASYAGWAGFECRRIATAADEEQLTRSLSHLRSLVPVT